MSDFINPLVQWSFFRFFSNKVKMHQTSEGFPQATERPKSPTRAASGSSHSILKYMTIEKTKQCVLRR